MIKTILLLCLASSIHFALADYSPADGLEYAYASALAYCKPNDIMSWDCGAACKNLTGYQAFYSNIFNITTDQTLSFSMIFNPTTQKFLTIFRGTVGDVQVLIEIMQDIPVPYELTNITNARVMKYFYTHYGKDLRPEFIEKLEAAYAAYPNYTFVFTGHSLGAALTTIAAFDAVSSGLIPKEKIIMYNYGSPRVGNYDFAQAVMEAIPVIYRITHWKDMAPHIPPCATNSSKNCVPQKSRTNLQGDSIIWPAWHVSQQIFYNEANTQFQTCNGDEDRSCADQFELPQTTMGEHYYYVNVHIACDGESVTKASSTTIQESDVFDRFRRWW